MFEKVSVAVLGVVENMSTHVCSHCGHEDAIFGAGGGERLAAECNVALLGKLPLDTPDPRRVRRAASPPCWRRRTRRARSAWIDWRATPQERWPAGRVIAVAVFRMSSSREFHEHQVRPLDPPHGGRTTA